MMSELGPEEDGQDREEMLVDGRDEREAEGADPMMYRDAQPGISG